MPEGKALQEWGGATPKDAKRVPVRTTRGDEEVSSAERYPSRGNQDQDPWARRAPPAARPPPAAQPEPHVPVVVRAEAANPVALLHVLRGALATAGIEGADAAKDADEAVAMLLAAGIGLGKAQPACTVTSVPVLYPVQKPPGDQQPAAAMCGPHVVHRGDFLLVRLGAPPPEVFTPVLGLPGACSASFVIDFFCSFDNLPGVPPLKVRLLCRLYLAL